MSDILNAAATPVIVPPVPGAGTPWFTGKVDSETIGYWQNKGLDVNDPVTVANGITKFYREAESKLGVPASQLLLLPVDPLKDSDGMKAIWQRLGAPLDAKDYDFPALKGADGKVTNTALESALRTAAGEAMLPKDAAAKVAASVSKYLADTKTASEAEHAANLVKERDALAKNWGANAQINLAVAKNAATALGITPEEVSALESVIGYSRVMETLRNIGSKIGEDKFIRAPGQDGTKVASVDQAKARLAELGKDEAFRSRYMAGDSAAKREMGDLMVLISSEVSEKDSFNTGLK